VPDLPGFSFDAQWHRLSISLDRHRFGFHFHWNEHFGGSRTNPEKTDSILGWSVVNRLGLSEPDGILHRLRSRPSFGAGAACLAGEPKLEKNVYPRAIWLVAICANLHFLFDMASLLLHQ